MILLHDMTIGIRIDHKVVILDFSSKSPHMYVLQTELFANFRIFTDHPFFSRFQNEKKSEKLERI